MRWVAGLFALTLLAGQDVQAGPAAGACFWVHGRLSAANGAPTFRLWPIGTKRILGVNVAHHEGAAIGDLPSPLPVLMSPDAFNVDVYGDFHICPMTPDQPGRMRFVRLEQARHPLARPAATRRGGIP
jgi:hypothetical protein